MVSKASTECQNKLVARDERHATCKVTELACIAEADDALEGTPGKGENPSRIPTNDHAQLTRHANWRSHFEVTSAHRSTGEVPGKGSPLVLLSRHYRHAARAVASERRIIFDLPRIALGAESCAHRIVHDGT